MSRYIDVNRPQTSWNGLNFVFLAFWLRDDLPPAFELSDRRRYFAMRVGHYSVRVDDTTYFFHPLESRSDDRLNHEYCHRVAHLAHNHHLTRYIVDLSGNGPVEIIVPPDK